MSHSLRHRDSLKPLLDNAKGADGRATRTQTGIRYSQGKLGNADATGGAVWWAHAATPVRCGTHQPACSWVVMMMVTIAVMVVVVGGGGGVVSGMCCDAPGRRGTSSLSLGLSCHR